VTTTDGKAYLEPAEAVALESAASNLRDRLLVRLLFHTGCRISEALGLSLEDLDFASGAVRIQHLKARVKLSCPACGAGLARMHRFCPGCGGPVDAPTAKEQERRRLRVIPLDAETLALLREYVDRGGPVRKDGRRLLFGINRHRAWQVVKECAEAAGLPRLVNPESGRLRGVSPHRLRDAFAVMAVKRDDSGDGLRLLQEMLGHASFNTTARYRKVAGAELREWYGKLWGRDGRGG